MITNIQGYSIHDGPGIRTVVFLKGCPLRCQWCSNPENLTAGVQVGFIKNLCQNCGRCFKSCSYNAIIPGSGYRIAREKCVSCVECVSACYYGALIRYGEEKTSAETFEQVRKDKMFYESSGGGVTVSGGEPLLRSEFIFELFSLCKSDGIDTCVETCGYVPREAFERTLPVTDHIYFDLKLMKDDAHRKYTGCGNKLILENARYIVERGADVLFRQPLIPGVNDTEENICLTSEFMQSLGTGGVNIQLMPFHRLGKAKYDALDMTNITEDFKPMSPEEIESVREKYTSFCLNCTVSM